MSSQNHGGVYDRTASARSLIRHSVSRIMLAATKRRCPCNSFMQDVCRNTEDGVEEVVASATFHRLQRRKDKRIFDNELPVLALNPEGNNVDPCPTPLAVLRAVTYHIRTTRCWATLFMPMLIAAAMLVVIASSNGTLSAVSVPVILGYLLWSGRRTCWVHWHIPALCLTIERNVV